MAGRFSGWAGVGIFVTLCCFGEVGGMFEFGEGEGGRARVVL